MTATSRLRAAGGDEGEKKIILRKWKKSRKAKKLKKVGRPSKLTPEVQDEIVKAIENGTPQEKAAIAAGVQERTFYVWKEKGQLPEGVEYDEAKATPYQRFAHAVKRASAIFERAGVKTIAEWAPKSWQAQAWLLERLIPGTYALRRDIYVGAGDGKGGGKVHVVIEWPKDWREPIATVEVTATEAKA